jgi:hypothetical protein
MGDTPNWPFSDPPALATITLRQIIEEGQPILHVSHDADDGGWQFLDGGVPQAADARVVSLAHMFQSDPTIGQLADLPVGWVAWREQPESPWQREPHP